jgi:hypothetical protein
MAGLARELLRGLHPNPAIGVLDRFIASEQSASWRIVHEDEAFVLFAKRQIAVSLNESN